MCFYFKNKWKNEKVSICYDLVYFTTRVRHECNTKNTSEKGVRHESRECDTSATRTTQVRQSTSERQEFDTSEKL